MGSQERPKRKKPNQKEQNVKSLEFFKPTVATTLAIVLAWILSVRPAQAGYTVTLQQVGPDVVATGSGPLDLTGLYILPGSGLGLASSAEIEANSGTIVTGPTRTMNDRYTGGTLSGPMSFGSGDLTFASSGSGDRVGITFSPTSPGFMLRVPTGYVSGTALSGSAIYSGETFATLGVTPGTYVWKWGKGANQKFTLKIAGQSGTWTPTGSLATARDFYTATLLPNGKVLVAGGFDGNIVLAGAELYDPASGTWSVTGSLRTARVGPTATLLPNGKVLVAGGTTGDSNLASAELYDPGSGTWTATGSLGAERQFPTATLLPNGKVLVAGGFGSTGYLTSAELYDPASGTWSATGSLGTARELHTATLLPNGKVLVAGGFDSSGLLASAELYDPARGTWTTTGSLGITRYNHTATLLPNGKVLVAGGGQMIGELARAELYDPTLGTWSATGGLATAREQHTATLLPDGKVLVAGGSGSTAGYLASAELYDPASGTWSATGSLGTAREVHTATLLPNGNVLVAGGIGESLLLASAELYLGPAIPTKITNISSRASVGMAQNVTIAGFIVTGTDAKSVVVRGIGPTLGQKFNVQGALADPFLGLLDGNGNVLYENNNWKEPWGNYPTQQAEIQNLGLACAGHPCGPPDPLESAILQTLPPGRYTAILSGSNGTTGVGLVEVYDVSTGVSAEFTNVSTRGFVGTGDNVLIAGFISDGSTQVVLRGIGPTLGQKFNVQGALADPVLSLHDSNGNVLYENNNWKEPWGNYPTQEAEIQNLGLACAGHACGPPDDHESAILRTVAPGNYTAILSGNGGGTGIGLVEVYKLP
jgi:WD40 repeat protein